MIEKPVCIIGCGPIGLSFALLLAEMKVPTLICEAFTSDSFWQRSDHLLKLPQLFFPKWTKGHFTKSLIAERSFLLD